MPSKTSKPWAIEDFTCPFMATDALETRCITTLIFILLI
jgi:hypothetical protein